MSVCIIIVGVVVLVTSQTCTGFVIVLWVFQYYTQIVSAISGVPWGIMDLTRREESPWTNASHWRLKFFQSKFIFIFSAPLIYIV